MKTVSIDELREALKQTGYHKINLLIARCQIEEDSAEEFSSETIRTIAWSMLDRDLESKLLNKLAI